MTNLLQTIGNKSSFRMGFDRFRMKKISFDLEHCFQLLLLHVYAFSFRRYLLRRKNLIEEKEEREEKRRNSN